MLGSFRKGRAVAAILPTVAGLGSCGACGPQTAVLENAVGPAITITGPTSVEAGKTATFSVVAQGVGAGKPCPYQAAFSFTPEGSQDSTKVIARNFAVDRRPNGDCVTSATVATAPSSQHVFASTGSAHNVTVDVELATEKTIDRAKGSLTVRVEQPASGTTQPPAGGTPNPAPSPAPGKQALQFEASANYATQGHPQAVIARDLRLGLPSGDGRASVAVADDFTDPGTSDVVRVWRSNANGSLDTSGAAYGSAADNPQDLVSADFDGDGLPDLAVSRHKSGATGEVGIWRNAGNGTFSAGGQFSAGGNGTLGITAADLRGAGLSDVAVANSSSDTIGVLANGAQGLPAGVFPSPVTFASGGGFPSEVAAGDLDGDGRRDLVVANDTGTRLTTLRNTTAGSPPAVAFDSAQAVSGYTGQAPKGVATGDLNGDGKADVVVANFESDDVSVLLNTTTGAGAPITFSERRFGAGDGPLAITLGDFDGDGKADVAVANHLASSASVLRGDGTGAFEAALAVAAGKGPLDVAAGDVNGDGKDDLVVANYGSDSPETPGSVTVSLSRGLVAAKALARPLPDADATAAKTRTVKATGRLTVTNLKLGPLSWGNDGSAHVKGVTFAGRLKVTVAGGKRARKRLPAGALDLLDTVVASSGNVDRWFDPARANPIVMRGTVVARSRRNKKTVACMSAAPLKAPAGQPPAGQRLKVVGATGRAAKVTLTFDLAAFSLDDPQANPVVTVKVGTSKKSRKLSRGCKALVKKLPRK